MTTEKEEHKLNCDGFEITYTGQQIELDNNDCVKGTEVKLDDNHFLRMSIITSGPDGESANQVEFRLVTIEKQDDGEYEQDSELVDWFWGYGDDGRPFNIDAVLKEYWNMTKSYIHKTTNNKQQMSVFHLYNIDQSTYLLSVKAKTENDAYKRLRELVSNVTDFTHLHKSTNLSLLIEEYVSEVSKTLLDNQYQLRSLDITEEHVPTVEQLSSMITLLQNVSNNTLKLKSHLEQVKFFLANSQGKVLE